MNIETIKKNCTGCGLCQSVMNIEYKIDNKGFKIPLLEENKDAFEFCNKVCPGTLQSFKALELSKDVWGKRENIYWGYSTNEQIRFKASSGGVITALSIYLLEEKLVDGIIHVGRSKDSCIENAVFCSRTKEEVINRCGSRYSISSPLCDIIRMTKENEKYAFIGKPCDVTVLKNYLELDTNLKEKIPYVISFFCAGMPSKRANEQLLSSLNTNEKNCNYLNYRGNGWPGKAEAVDASGESSFMSYGDAWGGILGRDVHSFCRMCMDGIGERADISCGDGWYVNEKGEPDFTEREGRNIVFARNSAGLNILQDALKKGYISLQEFDKNEISILNQIQNYQFTRRSTMYDKIIAMKVLGKRVPDYDLKTLKKISQQQNYKKRISIFWGTVKRGIKGKI